MLEGVASLHELETHYSITDVLDRNDALDAKAEAERAVHERMKKRSR